MQQLNPQTIIDELSKRVQQLTLENVVLSAQLRELTEPQVTNAPVDNGSVVVIGDGTEE